VAWGSSAEKAVWLWDLAGPPDAAATALRANAWAVQGLFSPRGDWLVVAQAGWPLAFWPLRQPRVRLLAGHEQEVRRLVFTSDSRSLLSCALDDARAWPLGPGRGKARRVASAHPQQFMDVALSPDEKSLLLVGTNNTVFLTSSPAGEGRWLWGQPSPAIDRMLSAAAWDGSGRRVAAGSEYTATEPNVVLLFDLKTGSQRSLTLVPPGEAGRGYDWNALRLAFTPLGRLLVSGKGGLRWFDTATGASEWIWRTPTNTGVVFALSGDGRRLAAAARTPAETEANAVMLVNFASASWQSVSAHGTTVRSVALDATGRALVTGDEQGVVRVGLANGGEPHRLCCHAGVVLSVAISPDGEWVASASGSEIRLWPMPDLSKPPLHTLPYDELMARLHSLTNLQVVEDPASPTGYKLDVGPFPGWKDAPTW
jgi:WD40 repeat protein